MIIPKKRVADYLAWLSGLTTTKIRPYYESLSGPTQFGEIYEAAVKVVSDVLKRHGTSTDLTFHLSPGTPAMAAVWIILAKTRFPAELIESSKEHGVRTASVPFDISAEFIPDFCASPTGAGAAECRAAAGSAGVCRHHSPQRYHEAGDCPGQAGCTAGLSRC